MTGRWLLPAGDTGKPTWTVHTTGTPLAEICLGSGFAPVVDFTDPADIDALIWALAKARDALADAQTSAQETSLPGLGAQGEPATGTSVPELNTRQGHQCSDPPAESCADAGCPVHGESTWDEPEDLPPLPQRVPAVPPDTRVCPGCGGGFIGWEPNDGDLCGECEPPEPQPGGTIYPELTEEALAGSVPLVSLAPEPQEDEVKG